MKRVPIESLEYPGDGLHYDSGIPFTGIAVIRDNRSGFVQVEEEYKDGLLCGVVRTWSAPGVIESEEECSWGVRHGRYREWTGSGQLITDGVYQYGIRVSEKRWDQSGRVVEDFELRESDPDSETLRIARQSFGEQV